MYGCWVVGVFIRSGAGGVDVEEKGCQGESMWDAVPEVS